MRCDLDKDDGGPEWEGAAILVTGVKVAGGRLALNDMLSGYSGLVAAHGTSKPGSRDGRTTFLLDGGKLEVRTAVRNFDLDADTPEQTPSKEELPPFLAEKDRSAPMNGARGMFFWEHGGPLR